MKVLVCGLCLALCCPKAVIGQDHVFKLLITRGENAIERTDGTAEQAKSGDLIFEGDQLVVSGENAYLGLVHSSGRILDLKGEGSYDVEALLSKLNTTRQPVSQQYGKFISTRLSESARKILLNEGTRGTNDPIRVLLPGSVDCLGDKAVIRWITREETSEDAVFIVSVKSIFEEVLFETPTTKMQWTLNFQDVESENGIYVVSVRHRDQPKVRSGDHAIRKVALEEAGAVAEELEALQKEIKGDSPLEMLILASFYEEKGYLLDALTQYDLASATYPEVKGFYDLFVNSVLMDQ